MTERCIGIPSISVRTSLRRCLFFLVFLRAFFACNCSMLHIQQLINWEGTSCYVHHSRKKCGQNTDMQRVVGKNLIRL
jgi:hypothetical protein